MPYFAPSFKRKDMAKYNYQKSATCGTTREQYVARGSENQAVVYDDYAGFPYRVSFLGNRWWVTTPGEPLQPLSDLLDDDISFNFLCGADGKVGALALAMMLGKALTEPEDEVMRVMHKRVKSLKRLGVRMDLHDEQLTLELRVFKHSKDSLRRGKYSVWCHERDCFYNMLFDIDGFDSREQAKEWPDYYFEFLGELGIDFKLSEQND